MRFIPSGFELWRISFLSHVISYYFAEISTRSHVASRVIQHPRSFSENSSELSFQRWTWQASFAHWKLWNCRLSQRFHFTSNHHLETHNRHNDYPSKLISTCIVAFTQKSKTKKFYSYSINLHLVKKKTCIVRSRRTSIIESQETLLSQKKKKILRIRLDTVETEN